jgi:hypothetical protein
VGSRAVLDAVVKRKIPRPRREKLHPSNYTSTCLINLTSNYKKLCNIWEMTYRGFAARSYSIMFLHDASVTRAAMRVVYRGLPP